MSVPVSPDHEQALRDLFEALDEPTRQAWLGVHGPPFEETDAFSYIRAHADESIVGMDATLFLHLARIILKSTDRFAHILALSPSLASTFLILGVPLVKQLVDLVGAARRTTDASYQAAVTPGAEMWHPPPSCYQPYSAVTILDEVLRTRAAESRYAMERLLSVDSVTELYSPSEGSAAPAASPAGSSAAHAAEDDADTVAFSAPSSPVALPRVEPRSPPLPKRRRSTSASRAV